jgi:hypothetical protein
MSRYVEEPSVFVMSIGTLMMTEGYDLLDVTPYSLVDGYQIFRGTNCLIFKADGSNRLMHRVVPLYQITWYHILEAYNTYILCFEILQSLVIFVVSHAGYVLQ